MWKSLTFLCFGYTWSGSPCLLSVNLSMSPSICPSIYLYILPSMYLCGCLSIHLSVYLTMAIYLPVHLFVYLSICLPIYMSAWLSICLSIYLYIYQSMTFFFTTPTIKKIIVVSCFRFFVYGGILCSDVHFLY